MDTFHLLQRCIPHLPPPQADLLRHLDLGSLPSNPEARHGKKLETELFLLNNVVGAYACNDRSVSEGITNQDFKAVQDRIEKVNEK